VRGCQNIELHKKYQIRIENIYSLHRNGYTRGKYSFFLFRGVSESGIMVQSFSTEPEMSKLIK